MIKDIVVHVNGSAGDAVRLAYAEHLAQVFDAVLIGLNVHYLPEVMAMSDPNGSHYLQAMLDESATLAEGVDRQVASRLSALAVRSQLKRVDVLQGSLRGAVAGEARLADLFVGLRPYGEGGEGAAVGEAALFDAGRACLFVPPQGRPPQAYDRIAVAWKNSRPATRALAEAMPLLERAKSVSVILIEEGGASEERGEAPGADIAVHLDRHGLEVELRPVSGWSDIGEALLNEAGQIDAQMLVMGGFGHARLWEWVIGGVTRRVLSEARIPVLMSH